MQSRKASTFPDIAGFKLHHQDVCHLVYPAGQAFRQAYDLLNLLIGKR